MSEYKDYIYNTLKNISSIDNNEYKYNEILENIYYFMNSDDMKKSKSQAIKFTSMLTMLGMDDINFTIKNCKKSDTITKFIKKYFKYYIVCNFDNIVKYEKLTKKLIDTISKNYFEKIYYLIMYYSYRIFV